VAINGSNFSGATTVVLGTAATTGFAVVSDPP
jgi:hypothetical protein